MQKGDTSKAHEALLASQRALEELLDNSRVQADTQSYLARVYAGLGKKDAALEAGRRAIGSLPVSRDTLVGGFYLAQLAMAESQVGEQEPALNHIEQLLAIPVGHVLSRASLRLDPVSQTHESSFFRRIIFQRIDVSLTRRDRCRRKGSRKQRGCLRPQTSPSSILM